MNPRTVAEELFYSTVRIDTVKADGSRGSGTGFIFGHQIGDLKVPVMVTNKHVYKDTVSGKFTFILAKNNDPTMGPDLGNSVELVVPEKMWVGQWDGHPDPTVDVAVCAFPPMVENIREDLGKEIFYRAISSAMIPSAESLRDFDAIEQITFVGYPNGVWDTVQKLPVARRGTTASHMAIDFEGKPIFIIDASVFGGSSGSPVFVLDSGISRSHEGGIVIGSRPAYFVGIVAAVYFRTDLNKVVAVPIPTTTQQFAINQEMIDLGIVFKARTIVETIEAAVAKVGLFRAD